MFGKTILPGSDRSAWVKILTSVDPEAEDGYGYHGTFKTAETLVVLKTGAVVLERVIRGHKMEHTIWQLDEDGEWQSIESSTRPVWAIDLRDVAIELLGENE